MCVCVCVYVCLYMHMRISAAFALLHATVYYAKCCFLYALNFNPGINTKHVEVI